MTSRRSTNFHRLSDPVPYEFDPPPPPEVSADSKAEWKGSDSAFIPRHHQTYPLPRHTSATRAGEPVSPTQAAWNRRNARAGQASRAATSAGPSRAAALSAAEERDPRTRVTATISAYRDPRALEEETDSAMTSSEAETDGTSAPSSETGEEYEAPPAVTQPPSRRPSGAALGRASTVVGWEREPENEEATSNRKLGRYHTVLGDGSDEQRYQDQPQRTYASDSYGPTSMASRRHAAEPPLAGGFSTPARANVVRKDSLRSTSSPSTLRMDRATLTALGLAMPKAPVMGKYDTPVCEYDGTPLGVGLGALAGLSHGLPLGRKNSLNRIIMDEGLAKQLEVEKLTSSTLLSTAAPNPNGAFGFGSTPGQYAPGGTASGQTWGRRQASRLQQHYEPASSVTTLEDVEMEDVEAEQMQDSATSSVAAAMGSSSAGFRRQNTSAAIPAKSPSWQEAQELRRKQQQAEKEAAAAAAEQEREKRKKAADEEAEKQRLEEEAQQAARDARPKFVPTPSNRRMGFEVEPAQEVVPGDAGSESDTLLGICVLAVESIWPQHRPSNWSYEVKSTSAARGVLPLSTFVKEVLRRSRTLPNTLHIALYYLHQSRRSIRERVALSESAKKSYRDLLAKNAVNTSAKSTPSSSSDPRDGPSSPESSPKQPEIDRILQAMSDPVLCGRRMFLASLMCASKYLQDRNFSNRAWAKISGLPVKEVNSNERVFLNLIKYKLHIEASVFQKWTVRLAKLAEEKGKNGPAAAPKETPQPNEAPQASAPVTPKRPAAPAAAPLEATTSLPSLGERLVHQYRSTGNPGAAAVNISRAGTSTPVLARAATASGSVSASKSHGPSLSRQATYTEFAPATVDRYAEQTRRRKAQEDAERQAIAAAATAQSEREKQREKQRNRALASARVEAQVAAAQVQAQAQAASQHAATRERERERELARERERASRETYAVPEFRRNRTYGTAAPATTTEVEEPHMDLDLSALRERPPSSCGIQDSASADFAALPGHHPHHHASGYGSYYGQGRVEPEHHFRHGYRSFAAAHIY